MAMLPFPWWAVGSCAGCWSKGRVDQQPDISPILHQEVSSNAAKKTVPSRNSWKSLHFTSALSVSLPKQRMNQLMHFGGSLRWQIQMILGSSPVYPSSWCPSSPFPIPALIVWGCSLVSWRTGDQRASLGEDTIEALDGCKESARWLFEHAAEEGRPCGHKELLHWVLEEIHEVTVKACHWDIHFPTSYQDIFCNESVCFCV